MLQLKDHRQLTDFRWSLGSDTRVSRARGPNRSRMSNPLHWLARDGAMRETKLPRPDPVGCGSQEMGTKHGGYGRTETGGTGYRPASAAESGCELRRFRTHRQPPV